VQLYPRLQSRYAFEQNPFEAGPNETLSKVMLTPRTERFRVIAQKGTSSGSNGAPALRLDCVDGTCNGVYPIEITLMDGANHRPLASLTTSLIYLGDIRTTNRLNVAVSLPLDLTPTDLRTDTPLPTVEVTELNSVVQSISDSPRTPISLNVYGRLLARLQEDVTTHAPDAVSAHAALTSLRRLALNRKKDELLSTPYAPIDLNALVGGLGDATTTYNAQMAAADLLDKTLLRTSLPPSPYISPSAPNSNSATILGHAGVCDLALPLSSVFLNNQGNTAVAPFRLADSSCKNKQVLTVAVDPGYDSDITSSPADPQLAAHQLLADLAQTYFENPNSTNARGVVIAPTSWLTSAAFVTTLINGLEANPVLAPVTLSRLFQSVPVGADGEPTSAKLTTSSATAPITHKTLAATYGELNTVKVITPTDTNLLANLNGEIFSGESIGLGPNERRWFFDAPKRAITVIAKNLHLSGTTNVTFTSATGKIPITVHYGGDVFPVHVDLKIKSSSVDFPASEAQQHLTLTLPDTNEVLKVSTRTSGGFSFTLELVAPNGSIVLLPPSIFSITSTAASGVAIALSLGALFVLGLWWSRSILRHRREKSSKTSHRDENIDPTQEPESMLT
jgi:hypothetical protein